MIRLTVAMVLVICTGCDGQASSSKRALEQLDALQKKKAADAAAKREDKLAPLTPPADVVKLDPPYDESGSVRITADGPCPEGMWALFATEAPGATPEEKKENEANRKALAQGLREKQFMVKLRTGAGVTVKPYDAAKGELVIEVAGTIDCTDSRGHVAIAWAPARAESKGAAGELTPTMWVTGPVTFRLPIKTMAEAKAFETENKVGVSARVVFTAGKVEIDKRMKKVEKIEVGVEGTDEKVGYGGGMEDWGAGRLLHADLVGIRVAVDKEKKQLFDRRGASK